MALRGQTRQNAEGSEPILRAATPCLRARCSSQVRCFFRIRPRRAGDGLTVPLQLQMLPSEMLAAGATGNCHQTAITIRQGDRVRTGIGRRWPIHFFRRHPGDGTDPGLSGEVSMPASRDHPR